MVILVQYSDVKFSCADPHDYFSRMLNEQGFADLGGTGSARDFFMENSQGKFIPQFDVYGPVTLSKPMSYYGGNTAAGDDRHPDEMVVEACRLLDGEVDFSQYDRDGDGFIDNVFVFYAGRGENSGGGPDTVWPHSADIMDWDTTPYMFDGVRFNRYGCTNEVTREGRTEGVGCLFMNSRMCSASRTFMPPLQGAVHLPPVHGQPSITGLITTTAARLPTIQHSSVMPWDGLTH